MANYQKKYTFIDKNQMEKDYGIPWPPEWNTKKIDTFDKKKRLLGDCCLKSYAKDNLSTIDLKKYGFKYLEE